MKRFALPDLLDVLFYTAAAWLLSFGLLRYYRLPFALSLAVSLLLSAAVGAGCGLLLLLRRKKLVLKKSERERREKLLLHLALEEKENVRASLLAALTADGKRAELKDGVLFSDGEPVLPLFTMQPVTADAAARLVRKFRAAPFTLACNDVTPEADALLKSFGKKVLRGDEVFLLFERTGTTPSPLICGELPRRSAKARLSRTFSKKNARPFFVSGSLLLVMSLFALFPLYYLITGCVLLLTSVIVRAAGTA